MLSHGDQREALQVAAGRSGRPEYLLETVRKYLKSPEAVRPKARLRRASKLDPYAEYI